MVVGENMRFYMFRKIMFDFVFMNILINGFFYFVAFSTHKGALTMVNVQSDLLVGLIWLGVLCSGFGFYNTKRDLQNCKYDIEGYHVRPVYRKLPKTFLGRVAFLTVVVITCIYPLFMPIPQLLGAFEINHAIGLFLKAGASAVATGVIGHVVMNLCIMDYQDMQNAINAYSYS